MCSDFLLPTSWFMLLVLCFKNHNQTQSHLDFLKGMFCNFSFYVTVLKINCVKSSFSSSASFPFYFLSFFFLPFLFSFPFSSFFLPIVLMCGCCIKNIVHHLLFDKTLVDYICMILFPNTVLCSIDLFASICVLVITMCCKFRIMTSDFALHFHYWNSVLAILSFFLAK